MRLILLVVLSFFGVSSPGLTQTRQYVLDVQLNEQVHVGRLDGICALGQNLAKGCTAIRERKILDASVNPWQAIGRVNFASRQILTHCSGVLVSSRLVLTAAHCLFNNARKTWIPPSSIRFVAGYQRGKAVAISTVTRFIMDPVNDTRQRSFQAKTQQDWALLVLKDPLGDRVGFLPMTTKLDRNAAYSVAGYPALRKNVLSLATDCGAPVEGVETDLLIQRCSVMKGDSGAPLLMMQGDRLWVVGVLSALSSSRDGPVSVGVPSSTFSRYFNPI